MQARIHFREDAARREFSGGVALAGCDAQQNFDSLLDRADGINPELALGDRRNHIIAQHEIVNVLRGN